MDKETRSCDKCKGVLDTCWLEFKRKKLCSDCWAKMKNPPKINYITSEQLDISKGENKK